MINGVGRIVPDPAIINMLDRQRIEIVPALPTAFMGDDQIRLFEDFEMLHHGAPVELRETGAQIAGWVWGSSFKASSRDRRVAWASALKILSFLDSFDML